MNRAFKIISNILWILCTAGAIVYMLYAINKVEEYSAADIWLFILFFVLSFLTASGIHELGHAFFGLLSGMRARLTPKSFIPSLSANEALIIPRRTTKIKTRLIITSLGGLVFNLIFIVLGAVALFVPQIPIWIAPISIWNLSLFLDNAFPIEYKTGKSDGLVVYGLIKNTPEAQVMTAVLYAQAHILSGRPIQEINRSILFDLPQIREDEAAFISLCELRAEYLKATGDEEGASHEFARFKELKEEYL